MRTMPLTERITRARAEQVAADTAGDLTRCAYWERVVNRLLDELVQRDTTEASR